MTIENIQHAIAACNARCADANRLDKRISEAKSDRNALMKEFEDLAERYKKEKKDVEKLEGYSLDAFYHWLMNDKREALERERDEMLEAKIRLDEAAAAVREAEDAEDELAREREALGSPSAELATLEQQLESELASSDTPLGESLRKLGARESELTELKTELAEAVAAGETAYTNLREVQSHLSSAGNWGTWDLLGGGLLATYMKHDKLRGAQHHMQVARRAMRRFDQELRDVQQRVTAEIDLGSLTSFADYFFDGLLIDWFVQSKISKGKQAVEKALGKVRTIMSGLRSDLDVIRGELENLDEERRELIQRA